MKRGLKSEICFLFWLSSVWQRWSSSIHRGLYVVWPWWKDMRTSVSVKATLNKGKPTCRGVVILLVHNKISMMKHEQCFLRESSENPVMICCRMLFVHAIWIPTSSGCAVSKQQLELRLFGRLNSTSHQGLFRWCQVINSNEPPRNERSPKWILPNTMRGLEFKPETFKSQGQIVRQLKCQLLCGLLAKHPSSRSTVGAKETCAQSNDTLSSPNSLAPPFLGPMNATNKRDGDVLASLQKQIYTACVSFSVFVSLLKGPRELKVVQVS